MLRTRLRLGIVALVLATPSRLWAAPIVINFDTLSEFDSVTTQFAQATFTNATVLTAGSALNELEAPPHSGTNAIFDDGGAMSIALTSTFYSFGGYFSYAAPLTISAYDSTNTLLGSVSSLFSTNFLTSGASGSSPNEFLQLAFTSPIAFVTIVAAAEGGSFVLDDVTLNSAAPTTVPEPGTLWLVATGVACFVSVRRLRPHAATTD